MYATLNLKKLEESLPSKTLGDLWDAIRKPGVLISGDGEVVAVIEALDSIEYHPKEKPAPIGELEGR